MQRLFVSLLGWACIGAALPVDLPQARAFDRFITIWLENQVRCE
jgi:hypothetical protein